MGGRIVVPEVLKLVETYSNNASWKYRRAAVAGVNRLAEGCPQYFEKNYLPLSKQFLSKTIADPSPIVKYEVIQVSYRHTQPSPLEYFSLSIVSLLAVADIFLPNDFYL